MDELIEQAIAMLPSEADCRQAALDAEIGAVEEGATWPYLWPGGLRLAADLDQLIPFDSDSKQRLRVVDLGCGRGLLGALAAVMGFQRVRLIDGDPTPLALLRAGFSTSQQLSCDVVEWGKAIPGEAADILLGGDVLYRPEYHEALIRTIAESLSPQGFARATHALALRRTSLTSPLNTAVICTSKPDQAPQPVSITATNAVLRAILFRQG